MRAEAEAQSTGRNADSFAAPPAASGRALRSRRGQTDTATAITATAQVSAGSQRFSSPPKRRAGRKRNQTSSKPAATVANSKRGKKAATPHAEATAEVNSAPQEDVSLELQEDVSVELQAANAEAANVPQQPRVSADKADCNVEDSPVATPATALSLHGVQVEPDSDQQQLIAESLPAPSNALLEGSASPQAQREELMVGSSSKHRKRKQSAADEILAASSSKQTQSSVTKAQRMEGAVLGSPARPQPQDVTFDAVAELSQSDSQMQSESRQSQAANDSPDVHSPHVREQQHVDLPLSPVQPLTVHPSVVVPDSAPAESAAEARDHADVAASPGSARESDYQDAQERLSSPENAMPDVDKTGAEQPAEPLSRIVDEDVRQSDAVSPSRPLAEEDQEIGEVAMDAAAASTLSQTPSLVDDAQVEDAAEAAAAAPAAQVVDDAVAAGITVDQADTLDDEPSDGLSALGIAAALPLPSTNGAQGMPNPYAPDLFEIPRAEGCGANDMDSICMHAFVCMLLPMTPHGMCVRVIPCCIWSPSLNDE